MIPLLAVIGPIIAGVVSATHGSTGGGLTSALSTEHLQWGAQAPFAAKINAALKKHGVKPIDWDLNQ